uniref:Uncharacterized protein n=1 Tax=Arundo donax TaxID=35708 RepID=A0A0A9FTP4_ARUDO
MTGIGKTKYIFCNFFDPTFTTSTCSFMLTH